MMHKPVEDPRRLYAERVETLQEQIGEIPPYSKLQIDLDVLQDNTEYFYKGILTAEEICIGAMHAFWAHRKTLSLNEARSNLATLGRDVGVHANIPASQLETMWDFAHKYQAKQGRR